MSASPRTAVFSIVSPNYRHYTEVLMDSVRRHHPEWDRFVLIVGGEARAGEVSLDELPLPDRRRFTFRYTILELNTAVKPWMFEYVFARGYDRVVYLDPDIVLYAPLAELDPNAFLTLTPHLTGSIPGDDHPSERSILLAGTYNLGFLAVTRQPPLDRFLAWWQEKLEFQCVHDVARGLFVDQKWLDLAPGLFPGVAILRHDGYNVAYWNLGQRTVKIDGDAITVNGQPLRFFHFSGVDPDTHDMVSKHDLVTRRSEIGDARRLIDEYGRALRAAGHDENKRAPYVFGFFNDGTRINDGARISYRNSPELQEAAGDDPFAHPELFRPVNVATPKPRTFNFKTRAYFALSAPRRLVRLLPAPARRKLRELFLGPDPHPAPAMPAHAAATTGLASGLNIAGYVGRDTGVGESARLCRAACAAVGLPSRLIDIDSDVRADAVYNANIFHVNADMTPLVLQQQKQLVDSGAYNIGCWHWELPELPDEWIASAALLDEIWAPSAFVQSAVSRKVTIPVVHMPHGVEVTDVEPCSPGELGVPAGHFTFLCMFDLASVMDRKNPLAAVDAFVRAFHGDARASLLVKAGRAASHPKQYAELAERLRGLPNVYLSDRMLSRAKVNGLIAACDGVVSLHRSEGFGLILAEAMYFGKPVVATGWSGNADFMRGGNSCPVNYELVTLERDSPPYRAGSTWAEPDVDHAAHLMRRVVDDGAWRAQIGARARATMRTEFSAEAAGRRYRQRLELLGLLQS